MAMLLFSESEEWTVCLAKAAPFAFESKLGVVEFLADRT
jgi:hypothetical protein